MCSYPNKYFSSDVSMSYPSTKSKIIKVLLYFSHNYSFSLAVVKVHCILLTAFGSTTQSHQYFKLMLHVRF